MTRELGRLMNLISSIFEFLTTADNWTGADGIATRLGTHMWVSVTALAAAAIISLPIGVVLGHLHKGKVIGVGIANLSRAIPSFAVLAFVVAAGGGIGFVPTWTAMVALAIPPLFVGALIGVAEVDESVVSAARAMGMKPLQILRDAELPLAAPLLLSGFRVAFSQVIATATLGAFVGYNTLGRFITVGRANRDDAMLYGGVVIIVVTAIIIDALLRLLANRSLQWREGSN